MNNTSQSVFDSVRFPILDTLGQYSFGKFKDDLLAGVTVATLAVPQCMAYALLAELNPVYGLYAALMGVFIGALFSSSEKIITGPTAKISLVVGSVLVAYDALPPVQAVVLLTVMVGLIQIALACVQAGELASFVSHSVIEGFIVGGALVIIGDQIIYLLDAANGKSPYFFIRMFDAFRAVLSRGALPELRLFLGIGSICLIVGLRMIHEYIPAGIITIIMGGILSFALGFDKMGVDIVDTIPRGLPNFTLPAMSLDHVTGLFSGAFALAILGSVQALSISKSIAQTDNATVNDNQELFSQGVSNLFTGFFQGFPISASFTRSFLNDNVGAQTRFSAIFCGIAIGIIILLAAPYAYYLPIPVLAGLIIVVVSDVFDWDEIRMLFNITFLDRIAFGITSLSMLVFQLDTAIYVGVTTSLILYLNKASNLDLKEYIIDVEGELKQIHHPGDRREGRIALIDVNGEVFFGAARSIKERVRGLVEESDELRVVILRLKHALNFDSSSIHVLQEIAVELRNRDMTLLLSGTTPEIRRQLVESGVAEVIDENKILIAQSDLLESTRHAFRRAISHIEHVLEGDVAREDETPPLKHTLEELLTDDSNHSQDPIEEERTNPS